MSQGISTKVILINGVSFGIGIVTAEYDVTPLLVVADKNYQSDETEKSSRWQRFDYFRAEGNGQDE